MRYIPVAIAVLVLSAATVRGEETMGDPKVPSGLIEQAEAEGVVRVIVSARASDPDVIDTAGAGTRGLSANLESARLMLINSMPSSEATMAEPIGDHGQIVMEVTAEGLRTLAGSPLVASVVADALAAPQGPQDDASGDPARRRDGLDAPQ
jgi:hypothetical protein